MNASFGFDFADVRVHAGGRAGAIASELGTRAFAFGTDVAFAPGQYRPGEPGDRLLEHELGHVAEQAGGPPSIQRAPNIFDDEQVVSAPGKTVTLAQAQQSAHALVTAGDLTSVKVSGVTGKEELYLWWTLAQMGGRNKWGRELDLVIAIGPKPKTSAAPVGKVTVVIDDAGNATAQFLGAGAPKLTTSHTTLAAARPALIALGFSAVVDGTATWTPDELNKVASAVALLPAKDAAALKGAVLSREATLPDGAAGRYGDNRGATVTTPSAGPILEFANKAFATDSKRFVGDSKANLPGSAQTIVHEIGHAIADHKAFAANKRIDASVAAADAVAPTQKAASVARGLAAKNMNAARAEGIAAQKEGDAVKVKAARAKYNKLRVIYNAAVRADKRETKKLDAARATIKRRKTAHKATMISAKKLKALEKAVPATKKTFDATIATAKTTAASYTAAEKTASTGYLATIDAATTSIDAFSKGSTSKATNVSALEASAATAMEAITTAQSALATAAPTNSALVDFATAVTAQELWFSAARTFHRAPTRTARVQDFVDFVTKNKIAPITRYAADNWPHDPDEFYAEAFSLWRTDPTFLKTNVKKLYDWFQAGKHR